MIPQTRKGIGCLGSANSKDDRADGRGPGSRLSPQGSLVLHAHPGAAQKNIDIGHAGADIGIERIDDYLRAGPTDGSAIPGRQIKPFRQTD